MNKLTNKKKWDDLYKDKQEYYQDNTSQTRFDQELSTNKRFYDYSSHILWNRIFPKYMPKIKNAKVLEVGSAPGEFLVRLHKTYGFIVYGVDYSEPGIVINKKVFSSNNLDPDNVMHADFFHDNFQQKFRGYFDIVISRGFIEHFDNVENVIEKHINVLANGGYLIISVPNLGHHSIYGMWASCFDRQFLKMHNRNIMSRKTFAHIFDRDELSTLFCEYYGILSFGLLSVNNKILGRLTAGIFRRLRQPLNSIFYLLLGDKGARNRFFSSCLLYIGGKIKD